MIYIFYEQISCIFTIFTRDLDSKYWREKGISSPDNSFRKYLNLNLGHSASSDALKKIEEMADEIFEAIPE